MIRIFALSISLLAFSSIGFAQDPPDGSQGGGWRRLGDPQATDPNDSPRQEPDADRPVDAPDRRYGLPPQLTIKPGTFVTVRVNEWLSSDRNQSGDAFSGTLAKPLVVDGFVIAQRGQTVGGRVVEAQKALRGQGESRLALQLTELTVADGQQVPVESQLVSRTGAGTPGRDARTVVGTTVAGAAVGAIAARGVGATVGAIAGLSAGVLLTRGRPTVIYPETLLTFRIDSPVAVSTERAPQAFHQVEQNDYDRGSDHRYEAQGPPRRRCEGYGCPPPPYFYSYPYSYPYYGPGIAFFYAPRPYWGPGYYYGPRFGFRGRRW